MRSLTGYFEFSQLAQAAYAPFDAGAPETVLQSSRGGFTRSQVSAFLGLDESGIRIAGKGHTNLHHTPNDPDTGFSATVFRNNETGKITIAFRGTDDGADLLEDTYLATHGYARDQIYSLHNYIQRLFTPIDQTVAQWVRTTLIGPGGGAVTVWEQTGVAQGLGVIPEGTQFDVTGHSLGGHLAMAASRLFPALVDQVYTYNAPGFLNNATVNDFFSSLGGASSFPAERITNLYAEPGSEIITGLHEVSGEILPVFIEDQGLNIPGNHGIIPLTDALKLQSLFGFIDPGTAEPAGLDELSPILEAASSKPFIGSSNLPFNRSLESTLDALRTLFQVNYGTGTLDTAASVTSGGNRDAFYRNAIELEQHLKTLPFFNPVTQSLGFTVSPVSADPVTLTQGAAGNIATRYALYKLNTFEIHNADELYGAFNTDGALDLYDPITHTGKLTEEYLNDRAVFLVNKLTAGTENSEASGSPFVLTDGGMQYFEDREGSENYHLFAGSGPFVADLPTRTIASIKFGGPSADHLEASNKRDNLYGAAGNDFLRAGAGDDYLEGGAGEDIYYYASGDGHDEILDIDGRGRVLYADADGNQRLLTGGRQLVEGVNRYRSTSDPTIEYLHDNANDTLTVLIDAAPAITITDYRPGDLGIDLEDLSGSLLAALGPVRPEEDWQTVITGDQIPNLPDDDLTADPITEVIQGGDGDDVLLGRTGQEGYVQEIELFGGSGDDVLTGELNHTARFYEIGQAAFEAEQGLLQPGAGAQLYGEAGLDVLNGSLRDDLLDGGVDADTLFGHVGDDAAHGGSGNDWIDGNEGHDILQGDTGSDRLHAGAGRDHLIGGEGNDLLYGDSDTLNLLAWDGMNLTLPAGTLEDLAGRFPVLLDVPEAEAGHDVLEGGGGDDELYGGAGNDLIDGGAAADLAQGEGGDDIVFGGDGDDRLFGDNSIDAAEADAAVYRVSGPFEYYWRERDVGADGDDFLDGGAGDDRLWGGAGNDYLRGGEGNDALLGGLFDGSPSGDDVLEGGPGGDSLFGEDGDDIYRFGLGDGRDIAHDSRGQDTVEFGRDIRPSEVVLGAAVGPDGLTHFSLNVAGTNDTLILADWFGDTPDPETRIETIRYDDGTVWDAAYVQRRLRRIQAAGPVTDTAGLDSRYVTYLGPEMAEGFTIDIADNGGEDNLHFEPYVLGSTFFGNTYLRPLLESLQAEGDDLILDIRLDSGVVSTPDVRGSVRVAGYFADGEIETIDLSNVRGLQTEANARRSPGTYVSTYLTAPLFERFSPNQDYAGITSALYVGGDGNDTLTPLQSGSPGYDSRYYGGAGDDVITGGAGRDFIHGGAGADAMYGGGDSDSYYFDPDDADLIFDDGRGGRHVADDVLYLPDGISLAELDFAREGGDLLINNTRIQSYFALETTGQGVSGYPYMIEALVGADFRIDDLPSYLVDRGLLGTVSGTTGDDLLEGTPLADEMYGGAGDDILLGLDGGDSLYGGSGDDGLDGGFGHDRLEGGAGDDDLRGNVGRDVLDGGSGSDILQGWYGRDVLRAGNGDAASRDQLIGGGGSDTLVGGAGNDTLLGDDPASEQNGSFDSGFDYVSRRRRLPGNDVLDGGGGNDFLDGGSGGDTYEIYRGGGIDTVVDRGANFFASRLPVIEEEIEALDGHAGETYSTKSWFFYFFGEWTGGPLPEDIPQELFDAADALQDGLAIPQARDALGTIRSFMIESQHDTIRFGPGILPENIAVQWAPGGMSYIDESDDNRVTQGFLWVDVGDGDGVIVHGEAVERFRFQDGRVLTFAQLTALDVDDLDIGVIPGTGGDDVLEGARWGAGNNFFGYGGNDLIIGSTGGDQMFGGPGGDILVAQGNARGGSDWLEGGAASDAYLFNPGEINGFVNEAPDAGSNDFDTLSFGGGIRPEDVDAALGFEDFGGGESSVWLQLRLRTTGEELTTSWIETFDDGSGNLVTQDRRLERMQFLNGNDGRVFDLAALVNAREAELRAAYDPDTGAAGYIPLFRPEDIAAFDLTDQVDPAGGEFAAEYARRPPPPKELPALLGTSQSEILRGTGAAEHVSGFAGDDTLFGDAGDDILIGGTGMDTLIGGAGDDTYVLNLGDGQDTIVDVATPDAGNRIAFGRGITPDMLRLDVGSLVIRVGDQGDAISIPNFDAGDPYGGHAVERFDFADGSSLTYAQLIDRGFDISGTPGADIVHGTNAIDRIQALGGDDIIAAGAGDDVLDGGRGDDTYLLNRGDGSDLVIDVGGADRVVFGEDVDLSELRLTRAADDLTLHYGATDRVTVRDWFAGQPIESAEFADGTALSAAEIEALPGINQPPILANPMIDAAAAEDSLIDLTLPADTFTDPDPGDALTYGATLADGSALPAWLAFDPATANFSGTPGNGDVGSLDIRVSATDPAGATAEGVFRLTVTNVNDAPTVANAIPDQAAIEDAALSVTISADAFADVDAMHGDTLTYSASLANGSALPSWLSFDPGTLTFSGMPANDNVGVLDVRVTATDEEAASALDDFTLTVANVNDAPTVAAGIPDQSAREDAPFRFTVPGDAFEDVDAIHGDTLRYTAKSADGSTLPAWLAFDSDTGTFSGTPGNADVGAMRIAVTATDEGGLSASDTFGFSVANVNDAPVLAGALDDQAIDEYQAFSYQLPADRFHDPDIVHGDTLEYSASLADGSPLPEWLGFDPATRTFSAAPRFSERGTHDIRVQATDAAGASASGTFSLEVLAVGNGIAGGAGTDVLIGTAGDDVIAAGPGLDILLGGSGNDILDAGDGRDLLFAGRGDDRLFGGAGDDLLHGGRGDDVLHGGAGNDLLAGGAGADVYVFNRGDGEDKVVALGNPRSSPDTVELGADPLEIVFSHRGNGLEIDLHARDDRMRIIGWNARANQVGTISARDGSKLLDNQVEQLIQAMNQFSADNGGLTWDRAIAERPEAVEAILAAHWQPAAG